MQRYINSDEKDANLCSFGWHEGAPRSFVFKPAVCYGIVMSYEISIFYGGGV